jgi:voltage-gated potassium channel
MARVDQKPERGPRRVLYQVIFESDTRAGRAFDLLLISLIVLSVAAVLIESVQSLRSKHGPVLVAAEWTFTVLFTIEYVLRLSNVRKPLRYALSFYGIIDLLAILPTYLSLFIPGAQSLIVVRVLRVLRVFRILKLTEYLRESRTLSEALYASRRKIGVFILVVLTLIIIIGSLMYLIEGEENGFTDIPTSIYWAVVTLTTVGYGDIAPKTGLGRVVAGAVMILGYSIIAVPTGIVTAELTRAGRMGPIPVTCPSCRAGGHETDARYCRLCGTSLAPVPAT